MKLLTLSQQQASLRGGNRFVIISFLFSLFLLPLGGCGSGSPQATLPAPISQFIAINNPGGGITNVIGSPGAVEGGAIVTSFNSTQLAFAHKGTFEWIRSAHAQSALYEVETIANADGSFALTLNATEGDIVQVTQTVNGEESEPASFLVPPPVLILNPNAIP